MARRKAPTLASFGILWPESAAIGSHMPYFVASTFDHG
jgi:hypothetical protein